MSFLMMERDCGLDFRSQISNLRFQISVVRLALAFYLALSCLLCLVVSVVSCRGVSALRFEIIRR